MGCWHSLVDGRDPLRYEGGGDPGLTVVYDRIQHVGKHERVLEDVLVAFFFALRKRLSGCRTPVVYR